MLDEPRTSLDRPAGDPAGLAGRIRLRPAGRPGHAGTDRGGRRRLAGHPQRRTAARHRHQRLARLRRFRHRRQHRLCAWHAQRPVRPEREADRQHAADGAQHPAPRADPAGDPVVRHRRGGQAVPRRTGRVLPDLRQHAARRALGRSAIAGNGPRLRHVGTGDLLARGVPRRAAVDLRRPALRPRHHVADADRGGNDLRLLRHRLHGDERARVHDGRRRRRLHPDLRRTGQARRQRRRGCWSAPASPGTLSMRKPEP